jgi:hypothetical protein
VLGMTNSSGFTADNPLSSTLDAPTVGTWIQRISKYLTFGYITCRFAYFKTCININKIYWKVSFWHRCININL